MNDSDASGSGTVFAEITARSLGASVPCTVPSVYVPSWNLSGVDETLRTRWAFVTIWVSSQRKPVPCPWSVFSKTTDGIAVKSALKNGIEHTESSITVAVENEQDGCVVRIEDDGPGIPETQLTPIEAGTETNLQHGRGLGLWQLRWCVDELNGELSFDTSSGTTVRIAIPDQRD